jgi:hypothetical protein
MKQFKEKYKPLLLKVHFGLLIFFLIHFFIRLGTDISLIPYLIMPTKVIFYLSGVVLLFLTIKPFEKKAIYFSLYILSPIGVLLAFVGDAIFGVLIGSLFFWAFTTNEPITKSDNYKITKQFSGFLGSCCTYNLIKTKYVFEKQVGKFKIEDSYGIDPKFNYNDIDKSINLTYESRDFRGNYYKRDTTIIIK